MLVKIGPRGQITIPKSFRRSLDVAPGDKFAIVQVGDELHLKPVKKTIFDYIGFIPPSEGSADWSVIIEEAREQAWQERQMNDDE